MPNGYPIVEIFESIQGEGPSAGTPAVFIRLAGCNLKCAFCDTNHTENERLSVKEIVERVESFGRNLVIITGGEPFLHELAPLIKPLLKQFKEVEIETNGTQFNDTDIAPFTQVKINVSPKENTTLHPAILGLKFCFKFVITAEAVVDGYGIPENITLDRVLLDNDYTYLQPCDYTNTRHGIHKNQELNAAALKKTIGIVFKHNYKLSLQLHKILGIP